MEICAICGAKLTFFNTGIGSKLSTGEKICLQCMGSLESETIINLKKHSLDEIRDLIREKNIRDYELFKKKKEKAIAIDDQKKEEKRNLQYTKELTINKNAIIEYKRVCNQCGKVWHVLASREKYLEKEKTCNDCNQCSAALGSVNGNNHSWGTWTQAKRNEHALTNEIANLKQCPNCNSGDYTQSELVYEK